MRRIIPILFFCTIFLSCSNNKNLAQTASNTANDTLIQIINKSKRDTATMTKQMETLAKQNDLIIAFATLNYAWLRTGAFSVLACKNKQWKLYSFQSKLSNTISDSTISITSTDIPTSQAETIKHLYASSQLWTTSGDEKGKFCDNKDCNITDAETWTLSVATPENIHTTTYYAPQFFEQCCPGNPYRQRFIAIAKEMTKLMKKKDSM